LINTTYSEKFTVSPGGYSFSFFYSQKSCGVTGSPQAYFSGAGLADQGNNADIPGVESRHGIYPLRSWTKTKVRSLYWQTFAQPSLPPAAGNTHTDRIKKSKGDAEG
jgi:hypothetical protein